MAEDEDGFAADVEASVVVVNAWNREAVACEHDRQRVQVGRGPGGIFIRWRRKRVVAHTEGEVHRSTFETHRQLIARPDRQPGDQLKRLEPFIAGAARLQADRFELLRDVVTCRFKLRGAIASPFELVGRQELDVLQEGLWCNLDRSSDH
jgi:hypothetical protein